MIGDRIYHLDGVARLRHSLPAVLAVRPPQLAGDQRALGTGGLHGRVCLKKAASG